MSPLTNPIELSASINEADFEIFFILIFGLLLIKFFFILSQYIFNLDNPCDCAPTNSAFIIASADIFACVVLSEYFLKIYINFFFKTLAETFN